MLSNLSKNYNLIFVINTILSSAVIWSWYCYWSSNETQMRCIKTGIAYNSWKTTEIVGKEPRYELKKSQFFSYTKKNVRSCSSNTLYTLFTHINTYCVLCLRIIAKIVPLNQKLTINYDTLKTVNAYSNRSI